MVSGGHFLIPDRLKADGMTPRPQPHKVPMPQDRVKAADLASRSLLPSPLNSSRPRTLRSFNWPTASASPVLPAAPHPGAGQTTNMKRTAATRGIRLTSKTRRECTIAGQPTLVGFPRRTQYSRSGPLSVPGTAIYRDLLRLLPDATGHGSPPGFWSRPLHHIFAAWPTPISTPDPLPFRPPPGISPRNSIPSRLPPPPSAKDHSSSLPERGRGKRVPWCIGWPI